MGFSEISPRIPEVSNVLDTQKNRTYHYWHVLVPDLKPGQLYGFRAAGEFKPEQGLPFDSRKVLLDPYGLAVAIPKAHSRASGDTPAMKSIVSDPGAYDWEGDCPLQRPFVKTVIYETHVRGFTRHPASGVAPEKAGTYAGLIEKIPYLADLGITAVELIDQVILRCASAYSVPRPSRSVVDEQNVPSPPIFRPVRRILQRFFLIRGGGTGGGEF